ncbi:radical SAM protein [Thermodesulfovibrio sp. Kuro-1]|uniref:B12-binding domain-containing radical SAM protein n=1 Tax=Thermodesulfovibrio TaxID=28261 RepID=UPI0011440034|nr:B12-binding domain-containing radical SAM protein [Thermodesulfovibrio sp. Kuro-1]
MTYRVLLINPWIYDFAAYNFWARPLGLLKVAEFLSQFNLKLFFIDCCDSFTVKKYGTGKYSYQIVEKPDILRNVPKKYKRYGISLDEFIDKLKEIYHVDLILITSIMAYWWYGVNEVVNIIREKFPNIPIVIGGIYATLYKEHAKEKINADSIYTGQIEDRLIDNISNFGIKLKRVREQSKFWWQLGFYNKIPYAPILTSTGCPFRCHYCASSLIYKSFEQRKIEEVINEIEELYNMGVRDFAFYDDALLYKSETHLEPLLREIIKRNFQLRFHTPNGLHARFINKNVAQLMKKAGFKTLRLSLETVNIKRQIETGGKVTNEELEKAVFYLKEAGFLSQDIGVYIMYGLPEQSLDEVRVGVDFLKKLKVRIHLTEFSPIKGTYYWDELVKKGVIPDDLDPLLTNNTIFSELFSGYSKEELQRLKIEVNQFNLLL